MGKPAAPQVPAGGIFLTFIFLVSSSASYSNLLFSLQHGSVTPRVQRLSGAGKKPFLDFFLEPSDALQIYPSCARS